MRFFLCMVLFATALYGQRKQGSPLDHLPGNIEQLTYFGERADLSSDNRRVAFMAKSFGDAFVIDLKTRRITTAGLAHLAQGAWMEQMARNLTDADDGFLRGMKYLIHDRDLLFEVLSTGRSQTSKTILTVFRCPTPIEVRTDDVILLMSQGVRMGCGGFERDDLLSCVIRKRNAGLSNDAFILGGTPYCVLYVDMLVRDPGVPR